MAWALLPIWRQLFANCKIILISRISSARCEYYSHIIRGEFSLFTKLFPLSTGHSSAREKRLYWSRSRASEPRTFCVASGLDRKMDEIFWGVPWRQEVFNYCEVTIRRSVREFVAGTAGWDRFCRNPLTSRNIVYSLALCCEFIGTEICSAEFIHRLLRRRESSSLQVHFLLKDAFLNLLVVVVVVTRNKHINPHIYFLVRNKL